MESLSLLSSLKGEFKPEDYVLPHYKESYRLAIDTLVSGGKERYQDFLVSERIGDFLSEEELEFIMANMEKPPAASPSEDDEAPHDDTPSTGTYWPVDSDVETPDLDLGWPEFLPDPINRTKIDLFFHPPRQNCPTIKEVVRKHIQDARKVIAIVMDIFTDVDIFKEVVDASVRGVPVYLLLDDFQFKSFHTMAEKQEVQVQRLRNMRVRTVKGQEYLCRSGAKFHGAMEQKFVLIDCQTVVYGSYSFMWSFEKINLSMVQVITGQLVQSYDEEFRMLFARSTVPQVFAPETVLLDSNNGKWQNGTGPLASHVSHAGQQFERRDHLRHTLDTVYMKACGRQYNSKNNLGDYDSDVYHKRTPTYTPAIHTGFNVQNRIQQFQLPETKNYLKRHSYAGEKQESTYLPQRATRYLSSNWNVAADSDMHTAPGRNEYLSGGIGDQYHQGRLTQPYNRTSNVRQSFHGTDKQVLSLQQNMPTLERTAKSFLRTWRIESYLNNSDFPAGESGDYLDHLTIPYEGMDCKDNKPNPLYMHSRMRSSLVFKSTIPEQPESSSFATNSSSSKLHDDPALSCGNKFYSSLQRNPVVPMENMMRQEDYVLKRRSLQIYDEPKTNLSYANGKEPYHSVYSTLKRAPLKQPDFAQKEENYSYNRHNLNGSKSNVDCSARNGSSSYMFGALGQTNIMVQNEAERTVQNNPVVPQLEGQRSSSQHNIKNDVDKHVPSNSNWQTPPLRTVSVSSLGESNGQPSLKSNKGSEGSPRFFKKSTKKIKSLLSLSDKKDSSSKSKNDSNYKMCSSSDTLISDDDDQNSKSGKGKNGSTTNSIKSVDSTAHAKANSKPQAKENHFSHNVGGTSAPRFGTEQLHYQTEQEQRSTSDVSNVPPSTLERQRPQSGSARYERPGLATEAFRRSRLSEKRVYSRFEPFCTFEKQLSPADHTVTATTTIHAPEKKSLFSSRAGAGLLPHNGAGYQAYPPHENKFGRFMQRVGNFIHKHK
ncbi:protein FAM83B [Lepisosteus oculatus]|uniref:protein FAM83B n=1 Tax=Lepisosteus oculatus TaxID=7918 RepID=UPI0035F5023F